MKKEKKLALITGASRGLGLELAQTFADQNYDLILHSKEKQLPCVRKSFCWRREKETDYKVNCEAIHGELTEAPVLLNLVKAVEILGEGKGLDVLINNAGIHEFGDFETVDRNKYEETLNVNLLAPMLVTKYLWEVLKKKQGLAVFINSIAGKVGADKEFMYCASKHGLKGFADSLQFDATRAGVKVVSAYLGAMKTDMTAHRKDRDMLVDPREASKLLYDICKNYKSLRITEIDLCRRNY
ncbi:MAG: SDR family NAD(P)-dependent oxidoreductase [Candidatus Hodarchaeales archaeon]|jgi:short-subunit dehydrogenase